jgi:hypothetical protein
MRNYESPNYQQPVKAEARKRLLTHAVKTLTLERKNSTVIRIDELSSILSYAEWYLRTAGAPHEWLTNLSNEIGAFERFYNSRIGVKQPGDLKVLYLCGPEPYNDLEILLELGCLPENIWGIESNQNLYDQAVSQLIEKGISIKIHRGSLERFFEQVNSTFDLVYIDGCGPFLGGKPRTTAPLLELFARERLADFAVLITNYSEIPKDKEAAYVNAMAYFFGPRYNDVPKILLEDGFDPAESQFIPNEATNWIKHRISDCYSDFITRLTVDLGRCIIPTTRIGAYSDIRRRFFKDDKESKKEFNEILSPPKNDQELHEFLNWINSNNIHSLGLPLITFLSGSKECKDKDTNKLLEPIRSYTLNGSRIDETYLQFSPIEHLIEGYYHLATPEFLAAVKTGWFDTKVPYFCDPPLPHLTFHLLLAIYGHPYFVNPRETLRITYKAKQNRMYCDALAIDRCTYLFDLLPTIDMFPIRLKSVSFQLLLRACIDRIQWHDFSSSSNPLHGAALASIGEHELSSELEYEPRLEIIEPHSDSITFPKSSTDINISMVRDSHCKSDLHSWKLDVVEIKPKIQRPDDLAMLFGQCKPHIMCSSIWFKATAKQPNNDMYTILDKLLERLVEARYKRSCIVWGGFRHSVMSGMCGLLAITPHSKRHYRALLEAVNLLAFDIEEVVATDMLKKTDIPLMRIGGIEPPCRLWNEYFAVPNYFRTDNEQYREVLERNKACRSKTFLLAQDAVVVQDAFFRLEDLPIDG